MITNPGAATEAPSAHGATNLPDFSSFLTEADVTQPKQVRQEEVLALGFTPGKQQAPDLNEPQKKAHALSVGNKSFLKMLKCWSPLWDTPRPGHQSGVSQHSTGLDFPQDSESIRFLPFFTASQVFWTLSKL